MDILKVVKPKVDLGPFDSTISEFYEIKVRRALSRWGKRARDVEFSRVYRLFRTSESAFLARPAGA